MFRKFLEEGVHNCEQVYHILKTFEVMCTQVQGGLPFLPNLPYFTREEIYHILHCEEVYPSNFEEKCMLEHTQTDE